MIAFWKSAASARTKESLKLITSLISKRSASYLYYFMALISPKYTRHALGLKAGGLQNCETGRKARRLTWMSIKEATILAPG